MGQETDIHHAAGVKITPLRKRRLSGELYERDPKVEALIAELAMLPHDELITRAAITKRPDPAYVPSECLVYFTPQDDGVVHTLRPPRRDRSSNKFSGVWRWEAILPLADGAGPIADAAGRSRYPVNRSHVFGRFRIATFDAIDLAILVRHVDSPVYAMRL